MIVRAGSIRIASAALTIAALASLAMPAAAQAVTGGPTIQVSTPGQAPAIAADGNGGFIVAWHMTREGYTDIYARRFDASGSPLSSEITVSTTTTADEFSPAITADPGGDFTIAWESDQRAGSGRDIYARRFDAAGAPLSGEIAVNTTTTGKQWEPAIATTANGDFVVVWESCAHPVEFNPPNEGCSEQEGTGWDVYARRFDTSGVPLGGEIAVNTTMAGGQRAPTIAADPYGGFTVAWRSEAENDSRSVVYTRRFDAAGSPLSGELPVDGAPAPGVYQFSPTISADSSGGFDVAWGGNPGPNPVVYARHFDPSGVPLSGAVRVAPPTSYWASDPSIAADPGGGFTVAWDGSGDGLYARRFDASGAPLSDAVPVDPPGAFPMPAIAADGSGGFFVTWRHWATQIGVDYLAARHFISVPETRIESGPSGFTNEVPPTFAFSSDEVGSTFECRLDESAFAPCSSPVATTPPDGPHTFEVRATNPAGKTDATPAASSFTLDTVVPEAQIESGPSGPTEESAPTFAFSTNDPDATLECKLDFGGFSPCDSPLTLDPLSEGSSHLFSVRASDEAGNIDLTPASRTFTVDTTPPYIFFVSGPADGSITNDAAPSFGFTSNEAATFECQVDSEPFQPCASPFESAPLTDGAHLLTVRGTDVVGHTGAASRAFTLDTIAPETQIDSGPSGPTNVRAPTFAFSAEPGATFECELDGSGFAPCTPPLDTGALPDGPHTFEVRAIDEVSNIDPSPAIRAFAVDTLAPDTRIDSAPSNLTNKSSPTFAFSAGETGARFECRVDSGNFVPCASPFTSASLPEGPHTFEVQAIDQATNTDPTPASTAFTVDTRPPSVKLHTKRVLAAGGPIQLKVSCSEECAVLAAGSLEVRHGPKGATRPPELRLSLRTLTRQLRAGKSVILKLRPKGPGAGRRLSAALGRGAKARAAIELAITDRAGNSKALRLGVELRSR